MFYYSHHIGDFRSGTFNMTRQERWIYRDMLDVYYDNEKPFPVSLDEICKMVGVRNSEEKEIVESILLLKFELKESGYHNNRCDKEIADYRLKAETARINGGKGGRPPKNNPNKPSGFPVGSDPVLDRNPEETGLKANQEPVTKNQSIGKRGSRLTSDWKPTEEHLTFCKTERPDLLPHDVANRFVDYWVAQPGSKGTKADWMATWRNWVRNERKGPVAIAQPKVKDWE